MISIIKPRGDIKPNWESANPVLRYREWGVEWEESVGIGDVNIKIGDGVTHWNNLDYAIVNNITKKIVKNFASIIDSDENPIENPELAPGDSVETLFGKIKNKFDYTLNFINALKNMVGDYQEKSFNTGSGTVTASDLKNAIDILEQYKLTTANILDVNDSTNPDAALSANQGRLINNKVNANTNAIDVLNSNLDYDSFQFDTVTVSGNWSEELKLDLTDFELKGSTNYIIKVIGYMDAFLIGNISSSNNYHSQLLFSSGNLIQYRDKQRGIWHDWAKIFIDNNFYTGLGLIDLQSSDDLNDLITPGNYLNGVSSYGDTSKHYPRNSFAGMISVISRIPNNYWIFQIAYSDRDEMYIRHRYNNVWSSWTEK